MCGNTVEDVSLEFVEPRSYTDARADADEDGFADAAVEDVAEADQGQAAPADSTSEITVPMGTSREG